jgi:hypothetical protein
MVSWRSLYPRIATAGRPDMSASPDVANVNILLLLPLLALTSLFVAVRRRRPTAAPPGAGGHPESMTAVLAPGDEEYLAWLADHLWPNDDYLDLEERWRTELAPDDLVDENCPVCPGCRRPGDDVWPCPNCGFLVHSACRHGMRRRKIAKPYRTRDMSEESVVAEWVCSRCGSIVGLDVDRGDEETGHGLHQ